MTKLNQFLATILGGLLCLDVSVAQSERTEVCTSPGTKSVALDKRIGTIVDSTESQFVLEWQEGWVENLDKCFVFDQDIQIVNIRYSENAQRSDCRNLPAYQPRSWRQWAFEPAVPFYTYAKARLRKTYPISQLGGCEVGKLSKHLKGEDGLAKRRRGHLTALFSNGYAEFFSVNGAFDIVRFVVDLNSGEFSSECYDVMGKIRLSQKLNRPVGEIISHLYGNGLSEVTVPGAGMFDAQTNLLQLLEGRSPRPDCADAQSCACDHLLN